MPPTRQVSKISGRYNGHDKQPDGIAASDELSTTSGGIESPRHHIIKTRSGQAVCMPLGLGLMS